MNLHLVFRLLGIVAALMGGFMIFSLPWALPTIGRHTLVNASSPTMESRGLVALIVSLGICLVVSVTLFRLGGKQSGSIRLYRKEALAVVGLSWILATVLGAFPYYLTGVKRGPSLRLTAPSGEVLVAEPRWNFFFGWRSQGTVRPEQYELLQALLAAGADGLSRSQLTAAVGPDAVAHFDSLSQMPSWDSLLIGPGEDLEPAPRDRASNYRVRWVSMTFWDCLFESQSGFSTTGATVITDLEDPNLVPHCILFWRSSTHFLGGLGIIVLFVVLLGHGSAGKMMMQAEITGPTKDGTLARVQHAAWLFAGVYLALNAILIVLLLVLGMNLFDACCHAFGTMATGGFSTYNASIGSFASPSIEYAIIVFMILAGTNFTVLLMALLGEPRRLFGDLEWRTFIGIIVGYTTLIVILGMTSQADRFDSFGSALRFALFQVVSILTTTGYGTADFDGWGQVARSLMLALMFVGGCAGSTGGGAKVIRVVLLFKILLLELERAFHPRVVRTIRISGKPVDDDQLPRNILVYFAFLSVLLVVASLLVTGLESDKIWGANVDQKPLDSISTVIATLNNIGPGVGIVGPTQNFSPFSGCVKIIFVWLMMLGRLEIFAVLVLFVPAFWRRS